MTTQSATRNHDWSFSFEGVQYNLPQSFEKLYEMKEAVKELSESRVHSLMSFFAMAFAAIGITLSIIFFHDDQENLIPLIFGSIFILGMIFGGMAGFIIDAYLPEHFMRPKDLDAKIKQLASFEMLTKDQTREYIASCYEANIDEESLDYLVRVSWTSVLVEKDGQHRTVTGIHRGPHLILMEKVETHTAQREL